MKKTLLLKVFAAVTLLVVACTFFVCCNNEQAPATNLPEEQPSLNKDNNWWLDDFETVVQTDEEYSQKIGGFAKGVCHPTENYSQIKDANIEWIRIDINSLPFDEKGELEEEYLQFKNRASLYTQQGIKVMAVTPYPTKYIEAGLDPRLPESQAEIMQIARFYAEDLQGLVSAFQITNEMGIDHFTLPLTLEEAADFIGIQMKAMYRYRQNIVVGYNLSGLGGFFQLNSFMQPYLQYCDYVGTDIYLGCFESNFTKLSWMKMMIGLARDQTKKPIMVNEFGYIGSGQRKTEAVKLDILKLYGAEGETFAEAEAYTRSHMREIIYDEDFPPKFRKHLELVCEIDTSTMTESELAEAYTAMGNKLFDTELVSHLYRELKAGYQLTDYPHTWEGQGEFYTDCLAMLDELDYLYGAYIYCYADAEACYICDQTDCPVETGWGLVDGEGNPKPSYYAVQEAFAKIN